MSCVAASADRSAEPWTSPCSSVRAVLPTRVTVTSKGSSRRAISCPIPPTPTSSTRRSARDWRRSGRQRPYCWSRTAWSMPRSLARIKPTASSAVAAACTPEALATPAAGPAASMTPSYPVDCVWTNFSSSTWASDPRTAPALMYGRMTPSISPSAASSGSDNMSQTTPLSPSGRGARSASSCRSGKLTVRTGCIGNLFLWIWGGLGGRGGG
jgi:hypothetical protein